MARLKPEALLAEELAKLVTHLKPYQNAQSWGTLYYEAHATWQGAIKLAEAVAEVRRSHETPERAVAR